MRLETGGFTVVLNVPGSEGGHGCVLLDHEWVDEAGISKRRMTWMNGKGEVDAGLSPL